MCSFSLMTITAACNLLGAFSSHSELESYEIEWDIDGRCRTNSIQARVNDLARIIRDEDPIVLTEGGRVKLSKVVLLKTINCPERYRSGAAWLKLVAGLEFDGFYISENFVSPEEQWWHREVQYELRRMYPNDIPELDFREAETEIFSILNAENFATSLGHLRQAINCFSRGEWAAANSQLRSFFEGYLKEVAHTLGSGNNLQNNQCYNYLGREVNPPFLFESLGEWKQSPNSPQFISGLMSRMHSEGSHPGLSDKDDCTFRLHITLITARLLLRRFSERET
ncbi:hypothetical protein WH96_01190 [Kiloniella spongiae]|uniref:Uncharacterized protein n=1 Tax=Kiloniella spongiae TaxID=1489064 RepID=A0A0H2MIF4_9PROT|nr:hypothetical protein [Kiloniella spongiae]KLN62178.1 hypothetical protein WH96_01190 [Kiloniella spongiae]